MVLNDYYETTVDDVCEEAGGSKGGFYGHFATKQHLFLAPLDEETSALNRVAGELADRPVSGVERVRHFTQAMLRVGDDPGRVQLRAALWSALAGDPIVRSRFARTAFGLLPLRATGLPPRRSAPVSVRSSPRHSPFERRHHSVPLAAVRALPSSRFSCFNLVHVQGGTTLPTGYLHRICPTARPGRCLVSHGELALLGQSTAGCGGQAARSFALIVAS